MKKKIFLYILLLSSINILANVSYDARKKSLKIGHEAEIGYYTKESISMGMESTNLGNNSILLGIKSKIWLSGEKSILIGRDGSLTGSDNIILGSKSKIHGSSDKYTKKSIIIGNDSEINTLNNPKEISDALIFGVESEIRKVNKAIALGNKTKVEIENSVAIGYESEANYTNSELNKLWSPAYLANNTGNSIGIVSVGKNGSERKIVNLAAGYKDTDAVNVKQLKSLAENRFKIETNKGSKEIKLEENLSFKLKGESGKIKTKLSGDEITITIDKTLNDKIENAANNDLSNLSEKGKKVIKDLSTETVNKVYTSLKNSKTKVALRSDEKILEIDKKEANDFNSNEYKLGINKEKLEENIKISYSANGENKKVVSLKDGFNFKSNNLKIENKDKGEILISISDEIMQKINEVKNVKSEPAVYTNLNGKTKLTLKNSDGSTIDPVILSNVADGIDENDAVNLSQLKKYKEITDKNINIVLNESNAAAVSAMAMSGIPQASLYTNKNMIGVGVSNYRGLQAVALGYSRIGESNDLVYKVQGSMNSLGFFGITAGMGYTFGKKDNFYENSKDRIDKLEKELVYLRAELKQLKEFLNGNGL